MYHAVGYAVFSFLEAILTFEHERIVAASKALKHSLVVCGRLRKKNSIGESLGKMVKKINYDQYTEEEAHAELCHAECLLLKAMLTFMEDETLGSFIKAGIKIRSCFNSYKYIFRNRPRIQSAESVNELNYLVFESHQKVLF